MGSVHSTEPIMTVAQMAAVDAAAIDLDALIERAGHRVAAEARSLMVGTYGRRIVVAAGRGNNGADGRVAAEHLRRGGAHVDVCGADDLAGQRQPDLLIDAVVGAGLSRPFTAPPLPWPRRPLVVAVDVPSGLDGDTGRVSSRSWTADRTVTFGTLKPGHVLADGPVTCGEIVVVDIGLDLSVVDPMMWMLRPGAAAGWLRRRHRDDHKWTGAVRLIAGSRDMQGAASLSASAALGAGAGMVVVSSADGSALESLPVEAITASPTDPLAGLDVADRYGSVVIGPGCGPLDGAEVSNAVARRERGVVVVDADALTAIAPYASTVARSAATVVLTPHDGELARLEVGDEPADRLARVRSVASRFGSFVVSKGPTVLVASPTGRVVVVDHGDERLATAGTGDVLSGVLAALVVPDGEDLEVAHRVAAAVVVHAEAGRVAGTVGITASQIAAALPEAIARLSR